MQIADMRSGELNISTEFKKLFPWTAKMKTDSLFASMQEEYRAEGISWHNIDYIDNTGCINLISKKPTALFHLLDEECKWVCFTSPGPWCPDGKARMVWLQSEMLLQTSDRKQLTGCFF